MRQGRGPERGQDDAAGVGVSPARAARWQACAAGPQPTRRAASRSPAALSPAVLLAPDASVPSGGADAPQPLPLALQEAGGRSGAGEWAAGHRSVLSGAEETQALSPRGGSVFRSHFIFNNPESWRYFTNKESEAQRVRQLPKGTQAVMDQGQNPRVLTPGPLSLSWHVPWAGKGRPAWEHLRGERRGGPCSSSALGISSWRLTEGLRHAGHELHIPLQTTPPQHTQPRPCFCECLGKRQPSRLCVLWTCSAEPG